MYMWLATGCFIAGLVLLRRGWWGRYVGDHPHCRRCGFDLFGRPEGVWVCGECGAGLGGKDAITRGRFERRPRLMLAGGALLLPAVLGVAALTLDLSLDRYKPEAWLLAELRSSWPGSDRSDLLAEFDRRIDAAATEAERRRMANAAALAAVAVRGPLYNDGTGGFALRHLDRLSQKTSDELLAKALGETEFHNRKDVAVPLISAGRASPEAVGQAVRAVLRDAAAGDDLWGHDEVLLAAVEGGTVNWPTLASDVDAALLIVARSGGGYGAGDVLINVLRAGGGTDAGRAAALEAVLHDLEKDDADDEQITLAAHLLADGGTPAQRAVYARALADVEVTIGLRVVGGVALKVDLDRDPVSDATDNWPASIRLDSLRLGDGPNLVAGHGPAAAEVWDDLPVLAAVVSAGDAARGSAVARIVVRVSVTPADGELIEWLHEAEAEVEVLADDEPAARVVTGAETDAEVRGAIEPTLMFEDGRLRARLLIDGEPARLAVRGELVDAAGRAWPGLNAVDTDARWCPRCGKPTCGSQDDEPLWLDFGLTEGDPPVGPLTLRLTSAVDEAGPTAEGRPIWGGEAAFGGLQIATPPR